MMRRGRWIVALLVLAGLVSGYDAVAAQSVTGDYGDAPDLGFGQRFPTLAATENADMDGWTGPVHLNTDVAWLGAAISAEDGPISPEDDFDDGWSPVEGTVTVTLAAGAPRGPYYLNIVADLNNSGHWNSTRTNQEWAVQNMPIEQDAGTTVAHAVPLTIPRARWVRITLTDAPIVADTFGAVGGWDGSGPVAGFAVGETEDYLTAVAVRPPSPPVSMTTAECGVIISLLNNMAWFRGRENVALADIRAEFDELVVQIEPLNEAAPAAIAAFFAALADADLTDYSEILAATEAALLAWGDGCTQTVNPDLCGAAPYIYARFYSSPTTASDFVDERPSELVMPILGQSVDGLWIQVRMPNGLSAWAPMALLSSYCSS